MTTGYTSIFYQTPDEDLDFWYRNLKASQQELSKLSSNSALEKTNVLIKLRETLLDEDKVTVPKGIDVFPNNKLWAFLTFSSLLISCIGVGLLSIEAEKERVAKTNTK